jgi:hypothetical protein
MKGEWKEIPRDGCSAQAAGLHATLNKQGHIVINQTTYKRLGEPKAALLLYDRVNHRIGVRPANPGLRNAFRIGKKGRSRIVRAYRLLADQGIDLPDTVEFSDPRIDEDDVLVLDLRSARVSKRYLSKLEHRRTRNQLQSAEMRVRS